MLVLMLTAPPQACSRIRPRLVPTPRNDSISPLRSVGPAFSLSNVYLHTRLIRFVQTSYLGVDFFPVDGQGFCSVYVDTHVFYHLFRICLPLKSFDCT